MVATIKLVPFSVSLLPLPSSTLLDVARAELREPIGPRLCAEAFVEASVWPLSAYDREETLLPLFIILLLDVEFALAIIVVFEVELKSFMLAMAAGTCDSSASSFAFG